MLVFLYKVVSMLFAAAIIGACGSIAAVVWIDSNMPDDNDNSAKARSNWWWRNAMRCTVAIAVLGVVMLMWPARFTGK